MATKYYALLTNIGAAKLANATALGEQVEITQMVVGDGNGVLPTPNPAQTALVHELRRAPLNTLTIDPVNTNQIIAEQVIPEDVGGWWIRELGLYDSDGDMIAIANCAETYKPLLQEGSGRVQVIRVILIVSSTQAVTLKIDPSVVLATRQYVDSQIIQVKAYVDQQLTAHLAAANPHTQYAPLNSPALTGSPTAPTPAKEDGSTKLATTAYVKTVAADYAPLVSPAITGTPTAPTAPQTVNNTQLATTAFVKAALAALVGSSPEALDTLNELATALGNDPNFATTMTNALAGKMEIAKNGADIANVSKFLQNLGLSDALHKGDGRFLAGTFVSDAVDKTSIGARAATGCQFMRAHQAPDAPDQINYWQIISLTEVQAPKSAVVVLAIPSSDHNAAIGFGTGDGISTWMRLPALEGAKFTGDISAPNMRADESVTIGDGSSGMAIGKIDGAGFGGNNLVIKSWNGIGFQNTNTDVTKAFIDTINGYIAAAKRVYAGNAFMDESGNISGGAWGGGNLAGVVGKKTDGDNVKQVGLYQSDKTRPYMLHTDNEGVFMATLAHLASTDSQIRADLQTWTNQNFVQAVRFGAVEQGNVYRAPGFADSLGYVITGIENGDNNDTPDRIQRRLFQGKVNGSWYTLGA